MKDLSLTVLNPSKPSKRGKVTDFTRASRRRLIDKAARLNKNHKETKFLTLTFHGFPTPDKAKVCFHRFLKRMRRRFPQSSALWRAEMQERGSPHFHLIIFGIRWWGHSEIQAIWTECTNEDVSYVWIKPMRSAKRVMAYISKYMSKPTNEGESALLDNASYLTDDERKWHGRHWGVFNKACLPMAERFVAVVRDEEIARYFWYEAKKVSHYKAGKTPIAAKLFTEHAQAYFDRATEMSNSALKSDDLEPDYRYLASRHTRSRIEQFFFGTLAQRRAASREGIVKVRAATLYSARDLDKGRA